MELKLPYINPQKFAGALMANYGFTRQKTWNADNLILPPDIGNGSLQLFIRNDIHFFRGKWHFNEETIFHSDDAVGKQGFIDFRISENGRIQSAAIEGLKKFEFDTTNVNGLRIFIPEAFFNTDKSKLLHRFEKYCLDKNITQLLQDVLAIDPTDVKLSIILESKILEFIYYWREFLNEKNTDQFFGDISAHQLSCIKTAKELLDKNINTTISIKTLSRKSGLNECDLKRCFRIAFGIPVRQYLIKSRIEKAHKMVTTTDLPIQDICEALGYSNRGHFAQLYKNFFGISPLADRLQHYQTRL